MNDNQMQAKIRGEMQLPVELYRSTPRPLPRDFGSNVFIQKRQQQTILWIGAGIFLMVLHFVPVIKALGFFSWPFLILFWIGLFSCAIGGFTWLKPLWFKPKKIKRAEDYVRHAEVAFAEVKELAKIPVSHDQEHVAFHAFVVKLAMEHPETGRAFESQARSDIFHCLEVVSPKFRTGDFVPVVWHKDKFDSTFKIYDFLEATPDSCLQRPSISIWPSVRDLALIFVGLSVLIWSAYICCKYEPVDSDWGWAEEDLQLAALIGISAGVISAIVSYWILSSRIKAMHAKNESAILDGEAFDVVLKKKPKWALPVFCLIVAVGVSLIGSCVAMAGCWAANAFLDKSPAKQEEVIITDTYKDIATAVHMEFIVEYEMKGVDRTLKFSTTPEHMASFKGPTGMAEVHAGYLGWRWVKTIKPINLDDENLKKAIN